jgi:hypothetical protein
MLGTVWSRIFRSDKVSHLFHCGEIDGATVFCVSHIRILRIEVVERETPVSENRRRNNVHMRAGVGTRRELELLQHIH